MGYRCGNAKGYTCGRDFQDQRGLTRHRLTCNVYKEAEAVRLARRKAEAHATLDRRRLQRQLVAGRDTQTEIMV
jgi:hypothetical protein